MYNRLSDASSNRVSNSPVETKDDYFANNYWKLPDAGSESIDDLLRADKETKFTESPVEAPDEFFSNNFWKLPGA